MLRFIGFNLSQCTLEALQAAQAFGPALLRTRGMFTTSQALDTDSVVVVGSVGFSSWVLRCLCLGRFSLLTRHTNATVYVCRSKLSGIGCPEEAEVKRPILAVYPPKRDRFVMTHVYPHRQVLVR